MATFSDASTKQLKKFLSCTICLNYYQDPRILPCSHTFCFQCIAKLIKNGSFDCPLQDDMKIAQTDLAHLPVNQTAKDMVDFIQSINLSTEKPLSQQCDNCDENEATNWCEKCSSQYCQTCTESVHSMKNFRSHIIVGLSEKVQTFCPHHIDQKFSSWCKKCEILVCRECLLEIDEIKRNLTTCSETTKKIINQQRNVTCQEKQDIEQTFANLQQILEEKKLAIIKQLEYNHLQTTNLLTRQRNMINQHLYLATVQDICIKKMLESNDPMQILKLKSALYRNYHEFLEQYNKIDDGYFIKIHLLKKYEKDIEQIYEIITKIGQINSTSYLVKGHDVTIKTTSLDISKPNGDMGLFTKENNYARGYKFFLKKQFKIRSIQIYSDHIGQITSFILNDQGIIVQKGTINSTNPIMKWLRIPIECDILNNYMIFVLPPSDNGSYSYKNGDNQLRVINQYCSVESKYIQAATQTNIGSKINVENNIASIDMILEIEGQG